MHDFVLPETVAGQLQGIDYTVILRSASGAPLGLFVPSVEPADYEIVGALPTSDELGQIEQSKEWFSTAQVFEHLERLQ